MYIEGQGEIVQSLAADVFFIHGWNTCNIRVHRSFSRAKELYSSKEAARMVYYCWDPIGYDAR